MSVSTEQNRSPVSSPDRCSMLKVSSGNLARGSPVRRNNEDVSESRLDDTAAIGFMAYSRLHNRWVSPFSPHRFRWHSREHRTCFWHQHSECDLRSIRRPRYATRRALQLAKSGNLSGFHPINVDLATVRTPGYKSDASSVRRPAW